MTSSEMGAAQHPPPPSLPSPGQQPPPQQQQADEASKLAVPTSEAEASCRAIRSSFPSQMQNGETAIEVAKGTECLASGDKHFRGGAWKDEWVISLIHLRGSMDDEFMKPQKPGIDMWSRVSTQITEANDDFDKNSESCRKKWQRVYKSFKDDKALIAAPGGDKQMSCKWFDLVDHYMRDHVDRNGNAIGSDELVPMDEVTHTDSALVVHQDTGVSGDHSAYRNKANVKRARRDQKIKESLSQMVETWRESLEVLKDSEAKRLEILQTLSTTMAGLLDVLRK